MWNDSTEESALVMDDGGAVLDEVRFVPDASHYEDCLDCDTMDALVPFGATEGERKLWEDLCADGDEDTSDTAIEFFTGEIDYTGLSLADEAPEPSLMERITNWIASWSNSSAQAA